MEYNDLTVLFLHVSYLDSAWLPSGIILAWFLSQHVPLLTNQQLVLKILELFKMVVFIKNSSRGHFSHFFFLVREEWGRAAVGSSETMIQPVIPICNVIKAKQVYAKWEEVVYFSHHGAHTSFKFKESSLFQLYLNNS